MISWLLTAVLLFAAVAITTPTSSADSPSRAAPSRGASAASEVAQVAAATATVAPTSIIDHQPGDNGSSPQSAGSPGWLPIEPANGEKSGSLNGGRLLNLQPEPIGSTRNSHSPSSLSRSENSNSQEKGVAITSGSRSPPYESLSTSDNYANASPVLTSGGRDRDKDVLGGGGDDDDAANTQPTANNSTANNPPTNQSRDLLKQHNSEHKTPARTQAIHEHPQQQQTSSKNQPKSIFTNQFVIEVKGGEEEARRLAEKHGFIYLNHILGDFYHLEHRRLAKRSLDLMDMNGLDRSIEEEPQVSNSLRPQVSWFGALLPLSLLRQANSDEEVANRSSEYLFSS